MQINCKEFIKDKQAIIKEEASKLQDVPTNCTILVGDNPASEIYVGKKSEVLEDLLMNNVIRRLSSDISQEDLEMEVMIAVNNPDYHTILVQLPLPEHIDTERVLSLIPPHKDIDGFSYYTLGRLFKNEAYTKPCTPAGVMSLLESIGGVKGKRVAVIGRSNILGKPLAVDLINNDAVVMVTHSKATDTIGAQLRDFKPEIIVSCVGKKDLLNIHNINKDVKVIIDCAIVRTESGLYGDFSKEDYKELDKLGVAYTAVPGGVGLLTTTMVAENLLKLYKVQKEEGNIND